jgi:hypothetical protein
MWRSRAQTLSAHSMLLVLPRTDPLGADSALDQPAVLAQNEQLATLLVDIDTICSFWQTVTASRSGRQPYRKANQVVLQHRATLSH